MDKKRILVVEDEIITATDLQSSLIALGYEVPAIVLNGEDAIRMAQETRPDLILMDIKLDGAMDGIEAANEIGKTESIPIVFLTACTDNEVLERSKKHQLYGYLTKPVNMQNLSIAVDVAIFKSAADAKVRESEQRHREIVELAKTVILRWDTSGTVTFINAYGAELFGYQKEELTGRNVMGSIVGETDSAGRNLRIMIEEIVINPEKYRDNENENKARDGRRLWMHWRNAALLDRNGKLVEILSIGNDITERKRTEKELKNHRKQLELMVEDRTKLLEKTVAELTGEITRRKRAETTLRKNTALIRSVFEGIQDGIVVLDVDQNITMTNRAVARFFRSEGSNGYKSKKCFQVFRQAVKPCDNCAAFRAIEKKTTQVETLPYQSDGKGDGWLERFTFPLYDEDGVVRGVVQYLRDITEKHILEERARRNDHLAALGQISAGIAHEVNNPNTIIMGNSELLKDVWRDADPVLAEYFSRQGDFMLGGLPFSAMRIKVDAMISRIIDGSVRINAIVDGMKQYTSRMRHDHTEKVVINDAVRTCIETLYGRIQKTTDAFSVDLGEGLPVVTGNRQALEEVFANLVSNALQSLTDRTKRVSVFTRYDLKDNSVIISVRDDGTGMTADVLRQAFNPFFTTRQGSGGTGLGLSISLAIVKTHHGSLDFESRPGQGTVATVRLPAEP